ncbi:TolC family protein [Crocinitomix sp.]|nr:TolC family protein [Crocinitomix sp.]
MKIYKLLVAVIIGVSPNLTIGQETTTFSLADAEEYGVNNNEIIKNAMLDIEVARKKVWETTAIGLPQVNIQGQFQQLLDIPVSVVDATLFNPMAEPGSVMEFQMGQEFNTSLTLNASQLIFDGSYIVGLQFSKFFQKMSSTAAHNTKQEVRALVREAYYNVLVANENVTLMDSILTATKGLWDKTSVYVEAGMIPQEDADQVAIAYNRIQASKSNALRQADVALNLLKLQMGYSFDQPLELVERLEDVMAQLKENNPILTASTVKENKNYVMLEQQKVLDEYSLKNENAAYLPSLGAFFTHSQNAYRSEFDIFQNKAWYPTTIWGLSMSIPVTSSGQKIMRVQQAEIKIEQDQNNLTNLEKSLQFQELQLKTTFQSAVEMVELERSSVDLARRIYDRALVRNTTGVVSALEVTQLQNQLLNAEGSYIKAVMDLLSVKVQLDKLYNK